MKVLHGDCLLELPKLADCSVDAIVTDPPYCLDSIRKRFGSPTAKPTKARQHKGIARGFMGHAWDDDIAFKSDVWRECLRVLKPGGYMVAFGGSRTHHRVWCAVEDAGFEIRDTLMWLHGQGFAKSHNLRNYETCECSGNTVSYDHNGQSNPQHYLRSTRVHEADLSQAKSFDTKQDEVLLDCLSEQALSQSRPAPICGSMGGEQSGMAGRQLHRAGQGLSHDTDAEPSTSASEWICSGTSPGGRADAGAPVDEHRGGSSSEPRQAGQSPRKPKSVRGSSRTLDDGALHGRGQCPRCGRLKKEFVSFGTALKPSHEPILLARKPLEGNIAQNVLAHGTGGINVDACRVPGAKPQVTRGRSAFMAQHDGRLSDDPSIGRWPPNLLHDGSEEVVECFPQTKTGDIKPYQGEPGSRAGLFDGGWGDKRDTHHKGDTGSAARFFPQLGFSDDERRLHSIHSLLSEHEIVILDVCNAKTAVTQLHQDQEGVSDPFVHKNARDGTSHNNAASSHQSPKNVQVADYSLRRLPAVIVSSAQTNAGELDAANNAQHAKSAAKQYDSCETNIAPSTAPIRIESMADFLAPFINATQNESALIIDTLIAMIHMCESVPWPKQEPDVLSLSRNHVKGVANLMPCGTMTIMISLSISDGSVQNATYSITPRNTDHGGRDCGQRIRYHPKASKRDRAGSKHPCVKPQALMRWLCRLITPTGGTVLDPFAGSGSTGVAALACGFDAILIEREDAYVADIQRRMGQSDSVFKFVTR